MIDDLRRSGSRVRMVFLDARTDVLIRRYESTRRRHPASSGDLLGAAIEQERQALEPMRADADVVVTSTAVKKDNPEVVAAQARKIPVIPRALMLAELMRFRDGIAIAGTHGKTTTTALTACLLDASGMQPGFLIGGQPVNFPHSARLGEEGAPFVIEGDEYDTAFFDKRAKFFHYLPEIAVVTSLEFDHADIYPDLEAIIRAFRLMLRQIPREGRLIVCADDPNALALREHAYCPVESYGFDASADWRGELAPFSGMPGGCVGLRVHRSGALWGDVTVPMAGRHNLRNALAAIAACAALGMSAADIAHAMPGFQGVKRRMEVFLEARGITFVDDFAHHPTAIRETIAAARQRWPRRKLHVLFEPRSNTVVTNRFQAEMNAAFREADAVWLMPNPYWKEEPGPRKTTRIDEFEIVSRPLTPDEMRARFRQFRSAVATQHQPAAAPVPLSDVPVSVDGQLGDGEWADASRVPIV